MAVRHTAIFADQIDDAALGNGLQKNSTDDTKFELALKTSGGLKFDVGEVAIEPADFAGDGLQDDGSDNLTLNLKTGGGLKIDTAQLAVEPSDFAGNGLEDDGSDNLQVKADTVGGTNLAKVVNVSANGVAIKIDDVMIGENASNQLYIKDASITEAKLDINNAPTDGYYLKWNATAGKFEWADIDTDAVQDDEVVANEIPSGLIDGSNTIFTLANTPVTGTVQVFLNGLLQAPGSGLDYTISGDTITFAKAPKTNSDLYVSYIKA